MAERVTRGEVELTEDAVLEANLRELNIDPRTIVGYRTTDDRIMQALETLARERKRPITPREILDAGVELGASGLRDRLSRLHSAGRVIRFVNPKKSDHWVYLPRIV